MADIKQAVIMAAGMGSRLRPHTLTTPKPMLRLAGRPILQWKIDQLPSQIEEVILVVGYLQEQVRQFFGDFWANKNITYVEQAELSGTGGAIHACRDYLNGRFIVLNGDDLYEADDIERICAFDFALAAYPTVEEKSFSSIVMNENGHLSGLTRNTEQPAGALQNIGLYAMDRRFFDVPLVPLKQRGEFGLPQTLVRLAQEIPVTVQMATFWFPVTFPENLEIGSQLVRERLL